MDIDLNVVVEELLEEFKALKLQNLFLKTAVKTLQQELDEVTTNLPEGYTKKPSRKRDMAIGVVSEEVD